MVTWAQTALHSGITHEPQPNFRQRKKKKENRKIERGEFITPPRPTGRQSNNCHNRICSERSRFTIRLGIAESHYVSIGDCWQCLFNQFHTPAVTYCPCFHTVKMRNSVLDCVFSADCNINQTAFYALNI